MIRLRFAWSDGFTEGLYGNSGVVDVWTGFLAFAGSLDHSTADCRYWLQVDGGEGMRQLVVLVGVAGSGKTSFRLQHPDWVVVSKDVIRRTVFHRDYDPVFEDSVEGIFASMLVETVESEAEVVCVDNSNLTGEERLRLIEVGKLAGRETIAYVMRLLSVEELYDRKTRQLSGLAEAFPDLVVRGFDRERFEELYRSYEPPLEAEGFDQIIADVVSVAPRRKVQRDRGKRVRARDAIEAANLDPLPLFAP